MFKKLNIPVFGVIENMSYFLSPSGEKMKMFPHGDLEKYLKTQEIDKLAEIPFTENTSMGCEIGIPVVISKPESFEAKIFQDIAQKIQRKFL
jgi:ATP-binding protein involved in chromosome partitioning